MREVKLSKYDFRAIAENAHRLYIERNPTKVGEDNFVCSCFIDSFVGYTKSQNWSVQNGKILKAETDEET